jgi:hypothetical protein
MRRDRSRLPGEQAPIAARNSKGFHRLKLALSLIGMARFQAIASSL